MYRVRAVGLMGPPDLGKAAQVPPAQEEAAQVPPARAEAAQVPQPSERCPAAQPPFPLPTLAQMAVLQLRVTEGHLCHCSSHLICFTCPQSLR